jgi:NAD(P)-dependent dehydrogenase (short-subunit alcohol dehydrogenase family)
VLARDRRWLRGAGPHYPQRVTLELMELARTTMNVSVGARVALVTGGTDGIGRAVALQLAAAGDRVLFVGRSRERGAKVLAALRKARPGVDHAFLPADLSLLSETARVADEIARRTGRLDAAVFCAGILATVPEWTDEGLERTFVLNYLSRYLLAQLLLPMLTQAPSGRLVLVSNAGKYRDSLDFEDLQHRRGRPGMTVSGRTQFANDLLATELAARVGSSRVEVTCVFPGVTNTAFLRNARGVPRIARLIAPVLVRLTAQAAEAAAETPVFLARDNGARGTNGRFYGPRLKERAIPARAKRPERRDGLWAASEDLVRPFLPRQSSSPAAANSFKPVGRISEA